MDKNSNIMKKDPTTEAVLLKKSSIPPPPPFQEQPKKSREHSDPAKTQFFDFHSRIMFKRIMDKESKRIYNSIEAYSLLYNKYNGSHRKCVNELMDIIEGEHKTLKIVDAEKVNQFKPVSF